MKKLFLMAFSLAIFGCATSATHIKSGEDISKVESPYIYGYTEIDFGYKFYLRMKNEKTGEYFKYSKSYWRWPFTKAKVLIAFQLPKGDWVLDRMGMESSGETIFPAEMTTRFSIDKNVGYYLGSYDITKSFMVVKVERAGGKDDVDMLMAQTYPTFDEKNTVFLITEN